LLKNKTYKGELKIKNYGWDFLCENLLADNAGCQGEG